MAKKYLHEVDMMRVFFIFGVLLNHTTTAFIQQMSSGGATRTALLGSHLLIHFTRMGFMFMTGLVLTLNYYHHHQWDRFFQKRFAGSGWPYLLWTGLYLGLAILIGAPSYHWATFWSDYADMILHGNAWYMYYILITLQLYLAFPLIVWLFKHIKHHEWLLGISFLLQLSIVTWIKYIMPGVDRSQWLWWFRAYGVNIFTYQFYFMLGAYTSIHYQQVTHWVTAHLRELTIASVTLGIGTIPYYFGNRVVLGLDHTHAVSPHQPYMLVYDIIVILAVFGLGQKFAAWRANGMPTWFATAVHNAAIVSFGVYLDQTLALSVLRGALSLMTLPDWVWVILIPVGYGAVLAMAVGIAWFCYKVPPFGLLIGRPQWHVLARNRRKKMPEKIIPSNSQTAKNVTE